MRQPWLRILLMLLEIIANMDNGDNHLTGKLEDLASNKLGTLFKLV